MEYKTDDNYSITLDGFEALPMKVRFKKLHEKAVAPARAHDTDAGFDLTAVSVKEDGVRNTLTYGTGIAVEIPKGYVGLLFPRSSVCKKSLSLANSVGIIDAGFRGEVKVVFRIEQPHILRYALGDRIAQLIIIPYPEVQFEEADELDDTERGDGGFGSTGK